jgi:hypothetical protein
LAETPVGEDPAKTSSYTSMDFVDSGISSVSGTDADVIPLLAFLGDPGANIIFPPTGSVDSPTAILTDDEVSDLGIRSVFPDTRDTRPTMDGLVIFKIGHMIDEVPLCQQNGNANC